MAKKIKTGDLLTMEGRPLRVPKRDADGDLVVKPRCPMCEQPTGNDPRVEMETLTTEKAIRMVIFQVPTVARKPEDGENSFRLIDAMRRNTEKDGTLTLEDADYDYLHRLMNRVLPDLDNDPPQYAPEETMAGALWGVNNWVVQRQLSEEGIDIVSEKVPS
jgi:hypothetical protein